MYVFYVEYNDHKKDFDVKQTYIVVVQQFQVVYLSHQGYKLDAKQEFVHYLPITYEKKKEKKNET